MFKKFLKSLLSDESGAMSSKRFVGIIASFILFTVMLMFVIMESANTPPDAIINGIVVIAVGCLGLSSVDKFSSK